MAWKCIYIMCKWHGQYTGL